MTATGGTSAGEMPAGIDPDDLVDPERYAQRGYPHALWTRLRNEAPVARFDPHGYEPFWAITKHADIMAISAQPLRFSSAKGILLARTGAPVYDPPEMVVMLDPPRHQPLRRIASPRFTPKAVRSAQAGLEDIVGRILDDVRTDGDAAQIDFVEKIAAPFPLAVIAWILGIPREDWADIYLWTNEIIGKDDPDFRREGESPGKTLMRARGEIHTYFTRLLADRRANPQDDLVTTLLEGKMDGRPLTEEQLIVYCELLVEAGNETTRNAITGGLLAFCEFPDQWAKLKADPELLTDAVEEVLRWVTPISHFTRVVTEDCEVRGVRMTAGDQVALYFASANRDEDVFDAPFEFRIDRRPNPHLAFGFGEHFCMGGQLARAELHTIFRHLLERLGTFELSGGIERLSSAVNGSIKHLPIRYEMS